MTATAVHVQCVHKLRVRVATSCKQHLMHVPNEVWEEVLRVNTGGFSATRITLPTNTFGDFSIHCAFFWCSSCLARRVQWHVGKEPHFLQHTFHDPPHHCLLVCTRHAPKTHMTHLDLMNCVRGPSLPESGGGGLARMSSSGGRTSAISHRERLLSKLPWKRVGPPWRKNEWELQYQMGFVRDQQLRVQQEDNFCVAQRCCGEGCAIARTTSGKTFSATIDSC